MKKSVLSILLCFFTLVNFAQDTITKNNSEKIIAKIIEINSTELKFKKFDFLDGPTYIEKKSDINFIVYSNGMKEVFKQEPAPKIEVKVSDNSDYYVGKSSESNKIEMWGSGRYRQKNVRIGERDVHTILMETKDKKIMTLVSSAKDAKAMQYIGFAAIPLGISAYGLLIASMIYGNTSASGSLGLNPGYVTGSAVCLVAAIACPIVSGTFKRKRTNYNRAAVKLYNEKY
ncbi:MAG: hypothetical protein NTX97_05000 [Bacteroidetes bacterium]|nr:hypothetical protein [Bacteroidota bacterium]